MIRQLRALMWVDRAEQVHAEFDADPSTVVGAHASRPGRPAAITVSRRALPPAAKA